MFRNGQTAGKRKNRTKENTLGRVAGAVVTYGTMLFVLIISVYPLLWIFISSFKSRMDIMDSPLKIPTRLFFDGYKAVFTSAPIATYFKNSIIVASFSTLMNIMLVAMAAYVVARFEFRMKNAVVAMFASTLFIPGIAISYPLFVMIRAVGLYNTKTGLTLTYAGLGIALTFFILRSYITSIPKEMDEAALIDGAGYLRIFLQFIVPLARPGIATAAILTFLFNWNDFFFALLLTGGDQSRTLPVVIFNFNSQFRGNLGALFASIVVIVTPTILIYSIASEQVVKSLMEGGVKA